MRFSITLLSLLFLTNCVPAVVAGVAGTGTIVAQERTPGAAVDDTAIYWNIKHLYLQQNAQDLLAGVGVKVIEGRVYLTGNVDTPEARVDAVRLAWQPEGVKEVHNEININSEKTITEVFSSTGIRTAVATKIIAAKDVRSLNYSVEVVSNVVYLMGIAQNQEELDKVIDIATNTKGVQKVVSHVVLKDSPERTKNAS
ncbi:MAG: osmY [Rickettsiaceae bacterium]|jgi:osmotically-inducible protein OsmY|nr:osmY [Rickettsiaceae bacterium]